MIKLWYVCVCLAAFVFMEAGAVKYCAVNGGFCRDEETCCPGGCCSADNPLCCDDGCCRENTQCCPGGINECCPNDNPVCCGNRRCCPENTQCCPYRGCCAENAHCCFDSCCPEAFPLCCPGKRCCRQGTHCCGAGCCPGPYPVCCTTHCCRSGYRCCRQGCCRFKRSIPGSPLELSDGNDMFSSFEAIAFDSNETSVFEVDFMVGGEDTYHSVDSHQTPPTLDGPCNSYERMVLNEGYRTHVYIDSVGKRTIGIGFNLDRLGAREKIEGVGADYDEVYSGNQELTREQIDRLFVMDMNDAIACGSQWLLQWASLGDGPKSAIADMAYNLGCAKLRKFVHLHDALSRTPPDCKWAASEMRNSLWCKQVGDRCDRDIACMQC